MSDGQIEAGGGKCTNADIEVLHLNKHAMTGCTIALQSGLPQAFVLATSFLKFQPRDQFAILVLDGGANSEQSRDGINLLYPADVDSEIGDEWHLPLLHNAVELSALLKPALLRTLLQSSASAAYFDPSTKIFASLDDIAVLVHSAKIVVASKVAESASGFAADDRVFNEESEAKSNFVAVGRDSEAFLQSWLDRLRNRSSGNESTSARSSPPAEGSGIDSFSKHEISDPAFEVGYWNLNAETFKWVEDHYECDGKPLRSFNFRGYDASKPHLLSKYQGLEPRLLLSEHPVVAKICDEYRDLLIRAGFHEHKSIPYRFDFLPSGLRIDHRMRSLYREALREYERGTAQKPPSPFGPGDESFLNWLNEPMGQTSPLVTRYMLAVHGARADVQKTFPDPIGSDAAAFHRWYLMFGQRELDLPAALLPRDAPRPSLDSSSARKPPVSISSAPSVNVAGYFRAELGIGAAARALVTAMEAAAIPLTTISFGGTASRQTHPFRDRPAPAGAADINIICVNADQMAAFAEKSGPELWHGRYTIGVWFWEVEDFPELFHGAFNYVDEVWVASNFMREAFLKVSPKPVFKFHLPALKPQIDLSLSRGDLGLTNQFVFLFNFDFLSVLERKNPLGLIEAFTHAFRPAEGPALVIKTINGEKRILEREKLRYVIRHRPDITLADGYLSAIENGTLMAQADCYVSLHRSEGYGLTIAEAMALGKPTIATAYSGNLEFMTAENSYLCPGERCTVGAEREPYPATSHWSEPDVEAAAVLLRHVYAHQDEARGRGLRAAEDMSVLHSPEVAGPIIRDRLAKIRRRRAASNPARSIAFLEDRLEELESGSAS